MGQVPSRITGKLVMPFQVVFTGCARDDFDRREGIKHLSEKFKLSFQQINKLLASGKSVIKKVDDRHMADKLVTKLWNAGWHSEIRNDQEVILTTASWPEDAALTVHAGQGAETSVEAEQPRNTTLAGEDCSVVVPQSWSVLQDLNRSAVLQAGDLALNQYLVVLKQNASDIAVANGVEDYCAAQIAQCANRVSAAEILVRATPLDREDCMGAFGEVSAEVAGIAVQYLIACVKFGDTIYTMFLWCERKDFEAVRTDFWNIAHGFTVEPPRPSGSNSADQSSPETHTSEELAT
ncbi:hypothetical protein ACNKU7_15810 [Microbulbifer sp. SA54]|uniref:hypothetical protein n=1 Tax=Microbulbifer sp. SA54 TaxID=3401577 RepID=UPI003AAB50AF